MMRDNRRTRFVLRALLLASFTLITLDLRGGGGPSAGSGRLPARLRPGRARGLRGRHARSATSSAVAPTTSRHASTSSSRRTPRCALEQRTDDYTRPAPQQLDDLLKVAGLGRYQIIPARVIAVGAAQGFD